ncbi:hypothetical protein MtrunA17_Chr5g0429131 [Medicago truncatula]|uniref:Uncharacterized protein n=1 Tax=Medicago truncatula TaxID=3880 RepID=A0A396HYB6_MEDTR|nr:hypothetical protein MtrunA17_Chr5g0429131 [Medicago truncatula]
MIMVAFMTEIFIEYTAVLTRATERFLSRRGMSLDGLRNRNLRFGSSSSSSDSTSFLVYF